MVRGELVAENFEDIEGEERRWASIVFMIIVFFASIIVAKKMNMQSDTKKHNFLYPV